eukprot:800050-Rhodomonas_salina.4
MIALPAPPPRSLACLCLDFQSASSLATLAPPGDPSTRPLSDTILSGASSHPSHPSRASHREASSELRSHLEAGAC